mmetsp:Transcript_27130/g.76552  ORF Transcript_27130/g.76552 Transcript_27130/m.76552 type:complete len:170 (+) Transcript_27130:826-1335(+)
MKINGATVRKHLIRLMRVYAKGQDIEGSLTPTELQAALAAEPPLSAKEQALHDMLDLWGWVEEEEYAFKGPPEQEEAAVHVKALLGELHVSWTTKEETAAAAKDRKSITEARQKRLDAEGVQSEVLALAAGRQRKRQRRANVDYELGSESEDEDMVADINLSPSEEARV